MKGFRRLALVTTLATYFLIFVGGLVRVAGAGLGCPDWPKCFGRWIPPLTAAQIPPEIDPGSFNVTLAWIEYVNRLVGVSVGLLIALTALMALIKYRRFPKIVWPSVFAALLVAFQGWLGAAVVASDLQPLVITAHLLLSLLIVSLLLFVNQETYYLYRTDKNAATVYPSRARLWTGILWLVSIIQILLGTEVRGSLETVTAQYPLWSVTERMARIGAINDIHMILGIILALFTGVVVYSLARVSHQPSPLVKQMGGILALLAVIQIGLGLALMMLGLSPLVQLFHQWVASIFVGVAMVLYVALKQTADRAEERRRSVLIPAVNVAVIIAVLAVGAFGVVRQAEDSQTSTTRIKKITDFTFTDMQGKPFGSEQMKGKLNIVEFFFTSCQGPCPTMAVELSRLYRDFAHSDKVRIVSITVDPETDSLPVLQQYARDLGVTDRRWRFVRGSAQETSRLCEEGFLVSGDLPGMHSTRFILVDPQGWIRGYYAYDDPAGMRRLRHDVIALAQDL